MIDTYGYLANTVLPGAAALLPDKMRSPVADFMLLAFGYQESRFLYRKQFNGPAKGFWQFERMAVQDVLERASSKEAIRQVLKTLNYDYAIDTSVEAITHNDVLAAVYGRLALWNEPTPLPLITDVEGMWQYYLRTWRPGKPRIGTWSISIAFAKEWADGSRTYRSV